MKPCWRRWRRRSLRSVLLMPLGGLTTAVTRSRFSTYEYRCKNLAMALSVEVSEIVEHFQWLTEEQSKDLPPEKLAELREEIGDVMIYLIELADKLGIDPVEDAKAKVESNKRKYPAALVRGKALKYTEYGEV